MPKLTMIDLVLKHYVSIVSDNAINNHIRFVSEFQRLGLLGFESFFVSTFLIYNVLVYFRLNETLRANTTIFNSLNLS